MASSTRKLQRKQSRKAKKRQQARALRADFEKSRGMLGRLNNDRPDLRSLVVNPSGQVKMSEVLLALVEPEMEMCTTDDAIRKLLTLGMAAWNASLMSDAKRTAMLQDLARTLPSECREDFYKIVAPFIRRKEQQFPHIRRPIISFDLTWLPSGEPHVTVLSGLMY